MKLAICLALFAITSFVASQLSNDPNFLVSYPWTVSATVPANLADTGCCMPGGLVSMTYDKYNSSYVKLNATQWNGGLCNDLGLSSDYLMIFPFSNISSYNQLVANNNVTTNSTNQQTLIFNIGNYSDINGILSWSFSINFEGTTFQGGICSITLITVVDPPANQPNFLLSHPWTVSATVPANLADTGCCMPGGLIYINNNGLSTEQVTLNATQWNGDLCTDLGLNPDSDLALPFNNISSYNQLVASNNQSTPFIGETLIYNIGNYSDVNGTLSWSLGINFEETTFGVQGGICSVTLMPYLATTQDLGTHNLGVGPSFLLIIAIYLSIL